MSVTSELREYFGKSKGAFTDHVLEIADRIDAEHEEAVQQEHETAYDKGYHDGSIHYELEHCPACKNVADLQEALEENAKLRKLCKDMYENPYALSECWECPHCGNGCIQNCYYRDQLRELGIEVTE